MVGSAFAARLRGPDELEHPEDQESAGTEGREQDPDLLEGTIGSTVGAKDDLGSFLMSKRLLLLLDNLEQLLPEAASVVAELLDAGVSPDGQPYLVLEYVEGEHIDRYCDNRRLDVETRLRLVLDVLVAGIFLLFGRSARRGRLGIYALGIIVYALDGLIFIYAADWFAFAFHVFATYSLVTGWRAGRALVRLDRPAPAAATAAG